MKLLCLVASAVAIVASTARADDRNVLIDFATGKYSTDGHNWSALPGPKGVRIAADESGNANVTVKNINTKAYTVKIEGESIATESEERLDALKILLSEGLEKADGPLRADPPPNREALFRAIRGEKNIPSGLLPAEEELVKSLNELHDKLKIVDKVNAEFTKFETDYSRSAVADLRDRVAAALNTSGTKIGDPVETIKAAIKDYQVAVQSVHQQIEDLLRSGDQTAIGNVNAIYDPAYQAWKKVADSLVKVLKAIASDDTFTVEGKPLNLSSQDAKFTVTITPKDANTPGAVEELGPFVFTFRAAREPQNYSIGLFYDSLVDDKFYIRQSDMTIQRNVKDDLHVGLAALYHWPITKASGSMPQLAFSLGAGIKSDADFRVYAGISAFLGERRGAVLTVGLAFSQVARLSGYNVGDPFTGNDIPTTKVTRGALMIGLSFRQ